MTKDFIDKAAFMNACPGAIIRSNGETLVLMPLVPISLIITVAISSPSAYDSLLLVQLNWHKITHSAKLNTSRKRPDEQYQDSKKVGLSEV